MNYHRTLTFFVGLALLVSTTDLFPKKSTSKLLKVPYIPQVQTEWCWAATSEMVMRYWQARDSTAQVLSQCQQAQSFYYSCRWLGKRPDPLLPCDSDSLNQPYEPFSPLMNQLYPVNYTHQLINEDTISWETVKMQIDSAQPFITGWQFTGVTPKAHEEHPGAYHFVVIDGYLTSSYTEDKFVSYSDPWSGTCAVHKIIRMEELNNPRQQGFLDSTAYRFNAHVGDFISIRPISQ